MAQPVASEGTGMIDPLRKLMLRPGVVVEEPAQAKGGGQGFRFMVQRDTFSRNLARVEWDNVL